MLPSYPISTRRFRFLSLLSLLISFSLQLAAQDSTLIQKLRVHSYSLELSNGQFSGEGAEVLTRALSGPQFVLIGEQHGIAEVGQFTQAVFERCSRQGFQYLALEVDPFIAQLLNELSKHRTIDSLKSFDKALPFTIPFYNNEEDFSMLHSAQAHSSAKRHVIWGLDQVAGAAPRYLFTRLIELAPDDKTLRLAEAYLERGHEGIRKFMETGNPGEGLMMQLREVDYKMLYDAFGTNPDTEAFQIISGIKMSQEIYSAWFEGRGYDNNFIRAQLMKDQFVRYYEDNMRNDEAKPRVVFKFGSNHMMRGLNTNNVYDIGNTLSELAEINGSHSLHIRFSGVKGTASSAFGGQQTFDITEDLEPHILAAIKERLDADGWVLMDMRPIRQLRLKNIDEELKRLIFGYDLLVFVPQAKAVTNFSN